MTGFFGRKKSLVVEVDRAVRLPELTGDLKENLKLLEHNPGFQYLLQRLRVQKAQLMAHLSEGLQLNEMQLRYLQAGLYWVGWLENEIQSLTVKRTTSRPPTANEEEQFQKIQASLQLVGVE